ncbi:sugar ABC transporter permease [Thermoclostridium stercorarium subsp. thermolacticum DSM 2910]|uniref:Sugar ABC transporter permease n=1 Tax=Thermoclostridium stercorarium subsp. thermolacticum DSM 2910 TaxID=1121336 RepID=A0A1B1YFE2_THEST|nr:carbohydrate ABC transporter permease [Thermoclostridium stercorarium]ANW99453.1 sugar ABC transporter permease [Thermoclostridium stercorarium subsp. thermolacticum DSM 2910]
MTGKTGFGEKVFNVINTLIMIFVIIITLYPMMHVLFASFSDGVELMMHRGVLLHPLGFTTDAYKLVFDNPILLNGYINTITLVLVGVTVNIILTSITAYFVSRKNVMWNRLMMFLIVITMYFNGGLIPNYLNIKQLGLYDTIWALILPGAISSYNMIIMRTAFLSVPDSLEEAARIDGANHFTILFRILFLLIMPTVAVLILYYAVGHWNGWFNAMIYLKSRTKYPLQLILREILINNDSSSMVATATGDTGDKLAISETVRYATIIVATLPILFVYPFLQKYFVKGVMIGAVKG